MPSTAMHPSGVKEDPMSHPQSRCPRAARIPRLESSGNNSPESTVGSGQDGQEGGGQPQKRASNEAGAVPGPQEEYSPFLSFFLSACLPLSLSLFPVSLPSLCLCLSLCIYDGDQRILHWRTSTCHQTTQTKSCAGQVTGGPAACVYFLGKGEGCEVPSRDLLGLALWARAWLPLGKPHSSASVCY